MAGSNSPKIVFVSYQKPLLEKLKIRTKKESQGDKLNFKVTKKMFSHLLAEDFDNKKPVIILMHGSGLTHSLVFARAVFATKGYSIL